MLWEKRIYGYENAFEQYGLDLKLSHQIFELLKGFLSGIILVFSIHAVNAFLGCATFSWPCSLSSLDAVTCFKVSLISVPGLWLLSLSLSGARQENGGSLSILIGIRTGIITSTFFLQKGGLLTYSNTGNFPLWITGTHPFQPFSSGLVGLVFSFSLAILLYPTRTQKKKAQK
ncbi:hypothetical protein HN51_011341 [Arachis hypogaea]